MRVSKFLFSSEKWLSQAIRRQAVPVMEHLFAVWLVHQKATVVVAVLVLIVAVQFRRT
jgi:hypothetical protein